METPEDIKGVPESFPLYVLIFLNAAFLLWVAYPFFLSETEWRGMGAPVYLLSPGVAGVLAIGVGLAAWFEPRGKGKAKWVVLGVLSIIGAFVGTAAATRFPW